MFDTQISLCGISGTSFDVGSLLLWPLPDRPPCVFRLAGALDFSGV